ncbi:MAG: hypothetical protein AAF170_01455 [Bacteroidota bacterium]
MRYFLSVLVFALVVSASAAQGGSRAVVIGADAYGPTAAYTVGVDALVLSSDDDVRAIRVRAGVGAWNEARPGGPGPNRYLVGSAGATALFSLGHPIGVPAAFEFGAGVAVDRLSGKSVLQLSGRASVVAAPYAEATARIWLGRFVGRGGVTWGGDPRGRSDMRQTIGVGIGL